MSFKKLLSLLLALAVVLSMTAMLTGCKDNQTSEDPSEPSAGKNASYTVNIASAGGMPLDGVEVYVYADSTLSDLKQYGETDENGTAKLELPEGGDYAIVLESVPAGYEKKDVYSFNGKKANIKLNSGLIKGENLSGASLGLGDIMYDFSVTAADGSTVTLSQMLEEKEMVLINFFFTTCGPCANEFPYMEEAYQLYKDTVGVIALDPLDDNATVAAYQQSMGLTFPMASCQAAWSQTFGITGYPTSIVVDRHGVICLVEVGGLTSLRPFSSMFEHFTGDDYEQKICYNGVADVIAPMKPTYEMPSSEEIAAVINNGEIPVTYHAETDEDSAEITWPFIITEKNGESCLKASNQGIEDSFAILYADVELKAGQAVGMDYLISSEQGLDRLVVIVDGEDIYQMSGVDENETWKTCYPWVATEDGTYEVALCYLKDEADNVGDDTVYIKNMRIVDMSEIDTATYLPRQAASTQDGFAYTYVDIVLNEKDNYYHVGSENGPLLLCNMMGYTQFSEEQTLWDICYDGAAKEYYEDMVDFFSYASNSNLNGYCTVTKELAEWLAKVDELAGFDEEDQFEWLRFCMYYEQYGTDTPMEDPIKGLATFSAYTAKEGKNVASNYFYYNRVIMPRGLFAEFIPTRSGVYRITSHNDSTNGVDGWIFDENRTELLTFEMDERLFGEEGEVSMVYYMEAGKPYYIDIAFWDPYEVGVITYDIEYLGATRQHFRMASPGPFTYDSDATGDAMYHTIAGGIDVILGEDGIYYEDLGDGKKGSKLYCDFTGISLFSQPIASVQAYDENGKPKYDENGERVMIKGMIEMGGFDFSKTEEDLYVLSILEAQGGDPAKAKEYLIGLWGADYDGYAEIYHVDEVLAGKYHGKGEDLTEEMKGYLSQMITSGGQEVRGCVVVTERLAEILQLLMDKYTFAGVDHSWTKLCYYYDYLGPNG